MTDMLRGLLLPESDVITNDSGAGNSDSEDGLDPAITAVPKDYEQLPADSRWLVP